MSLKKSFSAVFSAFKIYFWNKILYSQEILAISFMSENSLISEDDVLF